MSIEIGGRVNPEVGGIYYVRLHIPGLIPTNGRPIGRVLKVEPYVKNTLTSGLQVTLAILNTSDGQSNTVSVDRLLLEAVPDLVAFSYALKATP